MTLETNEILELIQEATKQFISETAIVLEIESTPLNMGYQAVNLSRHKVLIDDQGTQEYVSLITKMANKTERRILHRLFLQSAKVPFTRTHDIDSKDRALICIQDVDYKTNYQNLELEMLQKKEVRALAYIHKTNHGLREDLSWLPLADRDHIEKMINERWKPVWEKAKTNEQFIETFGKYIPEVEAVSHRIADDIEVVLNDESSHTLIHNDLNPANVLVHNNDDVLFIDWEEARYGSFFLDIPLRFDLSEVMASLGVETPVERFEKWYVIASRFLGIRFMTWNLSVWTTNPYAKDGLQKYLNMATS
ncbi:phosphotransferase family protein [Paenibacillus faecalis]|uniref:phosphotransferase family protein n=1 Tax=Paenibacillus faecalis TaxID=2079532 RepID=UPI000D0FB518|nr:phosphotransferase [Paenibacillus faecalis]